MTADEFRNWRERLGLNRIEAAAALGMGRNQPQRYEEGQPIPKYIALACAAIAFGIPPIGSNKWNQFRHSLRISSETTA